MKSATGYFGCTQCDIKGINKPYKNGNHVIFRYDEPSEMRTEDTYEENLLNMEKGVLGKCVLNELRYYHPIKSNQIDVMHSIFLGFCKLLFSYWFRSNLNERYCMKDKLDILNFNSIYKEETRFCNSYIFFEDKLGLNQKVPKKCFEITNRK